VKLYFFFAAYLLLQLTSLQTAFCAPQLDQYGGYSDLPILEKAPVWRTAKMNNRWFLVTPDGNAFINLGVYSVGEGQGSDVDGKSYFDYLRNKHTSNEKRICNAQLKRLRKWGFNSVSDYAYDYCRGFEPTVGSKSPYRTPSFNFPINGCDYSRRNARNFIDGHVKELIRPCNKNYDFYGAKVVDYFDPKFAQYIEATVQAYSKGKTVRDPWFIGISYDEGDNLYGFGAGDDWPGVTNAHLALIVLVTPPYQKTDPDKKWQYSDTETYSKTALKNFLKDRYSSIEALNRAWHSDYTSFESDGGWEVGNGLLDEDGRSSHKRWLGRDANLSDGSASPAVKKDLDDFLYLLADKYFSTYYTIIKKYFPDVLQVGPTVFGSWGKPPRKQVLQAAGKYLDVVRTSIGEPDLQKKIDFMVKHLGREIPIILWFGFTANSDSALYSYKSVNPSDAKTQVQRGQKYEEKLKKIFTTKSSNGTYLVTGIQLWAWTDHWGEKSNWGLVTIRDNAYDGVEAVKELKTDQDGFVIGGEERDYGDFITPVTAANNKVFEWISKNN
jgi:agarase